jgi:hypothetical protein
MIAKPHRTNSDFQIKNFLVGSCHTADGAWAVLYAEKINLEQKLKYSEATFLRREAKRIVAQRIIDDEDSDRVARLNAKADLVELDSEQPTHDLNVAAARAELATIVELMAELEPKRKYAHLPLLEANEAAQEEEWKLELMYRAENFLLTQSSIPHDHFARMREHPAFKTEILPWIDQTHKLMGAKKLDLILNNPTTKPLLLK